MQHLEEYLTGVGTWLPGEDRDGDLRELRTHLQQKLELKQREYARQGKRLEEADFVRQLPHPLIAAHLYWPPNRWLHPLLTPVLVRFIKEPGRAYYVPMIAIWLLCWAIANFITGKPEGLTIIGSLQPILFPTILFTAMLGTANAVLSILPEKDILMPRGI